MTTQKFVSSTVSHFLPGSLFCNYDDTFSEKYFYGGKGPPYDDNIFDTIGELACLTLRVYKRVAEVITSRLAISLVGRTEI